MAIFDTISFPPTDFVTGNPTIDGWTGNTDPGIAVHFPESGYATGGRISFDRRLDRAPGRLPVHAGTGHDRGRRRSPRAARRRLVPRARLLLHVSDPSFHAADGISIAFLEDFAVKNDTTARRIDLLPNTDGVGAGRRAAAMTRSPGRRRTTTRA